MHSISKTAITAVNNAEVTWQRDTETEVVNVTNPATGATWMDRNLGASRAATAFDDSESFGDLYQWGRAADGHEKPTSATTTTLSSSDQPGHGDFILTNSSPNDWRSPQNDNLWQGVDGVNNPCPVGYRLPTEAEWESERGSWSSDNRSGAYGSPLKLPSAGGRTYDDGSVSTAGSDGLYWSSTVDGSSARRLGFNSSTANVRSRSRANGRSVRCRKDASYAQKELHIKDTFARYGETATVRVQTNPISVTDSLSSFQFDLPIPNGLEFVSASLPENFSVDGTMVSNMEDNTLKVSFASQSSYMAGDTLLTNIELRGTEFGAFTLTPANGYFNSTPIDSVVSGVFNVVSLLLGDVNEDSLILAHDAAMANWYSVGADPLPNLDPLPWDPWRLIVADVNSDGNILADDASLILQKTVGLIDEFPESVVKSSSPRMTVRAENNKLYFSSEDDGLLGVNIYLPDVPGVIYGEPEFLTGSALTASHQTEEGFNLGIASIENLTGEFLQIPVSVANPEGSMVVTAFANSTYTELPVDLADVPTSVDEDHAMVYSYELYQNYPNPFNPTTEIRYTLAEMQPVRVDVFSITGEKVATIVNDVQPAGIHSVSFDAASMSSGVYLYRITTPAFTQTRSMILIK